MNFFKTLFLIILFNSLLLSDSIKEKYTDFIEMAVEEDKLLLIVFLSNDCPNCLKLSDSINTFQFKPEIEKQLSILYIYEEENIIEFEKYKAPVLILYNPELNKILNLKEYNNKNFEFIKMIEFEIKLRRI